MQKVKLFSPRELSKISGWPEKRIRNLIASGDLKHVKIGANYFAPEDAIEDFLRRNMVTPESPSISN